MSSDKYSVVLIFELVDKTLKCDFSNESYQAVISCGMVCLSSVLVTFELVDEILKCNVATWTSNL